jgi:peptidoglycan/LPS O-acetylase OafA/YrhL
MNNTSSEKILYLESLRGIAALCVVLFHARHYDSFLKNSLFIDNSGLMVDFFFVLSGFVIAFSYYDKLYSFRDLFNFQIKRFLRLYPLHLLMLLVFTFITLIRNYYITSFGLEADYQGSTGNNFNAFMHNLFLTHSFFVEDLTFNGQSWSISTEFYTYLIFGFILVFFRKNLYLLCTVLVISIIIASFGVYSIHDPTYLTIKNVTNGLGGISRCIYSFFIGSILFLITRHNNFVVMNLFQYVSLFICIAFMSSADLYMEFLIAPILFGTLIFSLINSKHSILKRFLNNKLLVYLGTISYGLYMIHIFVWWLINRILIEFLGFNSFCGEISKDCIETGPLIGNLVVVAGLILTYFLSGLSYKYLEMPVNAYRKRINV